MHGNLDVRAAESMVVVDFLDIQQQMPQDSGAMLHQKYEDNILKCTGIK
jgi:hypothetical protein